MYLNDLQRSEFYATIGLDAKQFDKHVIIKTNQSAGTLFPVIYDVENPDFFKLLDVCAEANQELIDIEKQDGSGITKLIQKVPSYFKMISGIVQLYLLPVIEMKYNWTEESYKVI
jgi:magnesium-protoporphyrin IX monomethyl ester (oxidative) cyclase